MSRGMGENGGTHVDENVVANADGRWSDPAFEALARLVVERTGLVFPPNRQASAEAGVRRAMRRAKINDAREYLDTIAGGGALMDDLLAELTVGETYFFRESAQFALLREEIVPRLAGRRAPAQGLRAWSAACASGEEAYSLAITLGELRPGVPDVVVGTDISRARLATARRGRYRRWSLRGVPEAVVSRYFRRHDDAYDLDPGVRRAAEFRYLNLAEDTYPAISTGVWGMDVVMCRNVLIYFDQPTIARVARRLVDSLSEDGWLLLGASDPVLSDVVACDVVQTPGGLVYRRPGAGRARVGRTVRPRQVVVPPSWRVVPGPATKDGTDGTVPVMAAPDRITPARISREHTTTPPNGGVAGAGSSAVSANPVSAAFAARDYARAVELARVRVEAGSDDADTATAFVRSLANLGCLDEAGRACAAALDRHRMSAELLYLHAILLTEAGRPQEAAAAARRALYLDRSMVVAHLALATALARTGAAEAARRSLANAERLLVALPPGAIVPASDGEPAGRLLAMARTQRTLLARGAA